MVGSGDRVDLVDGVDVGDLVECVGPVLLKLPINDYAVMAKIRNLWRLDVEQGVIWSVLSADRTST